MIETSCLLAIHTNNIDSSLNHKVLIHNIDKLSKEFEELTKDWEMDFESKSKILNTIALNIVESFTQNKVYTVKDILIREFPNKFRTFGVVTSALEHCFEINENGYVIDSDDGDLLNGMGYARFDVEEYLNYAKLCAFDLSKCNISNADILDFGYWDIDGIYHIPQTSWRVDSFHNRENSAEIQNQAIVESLLWIEKNRNI